jgi:hypothetical protein
MQLHLDEERLGQLMTVAKQRGTTHSKALDSTSPSPTLKSLRPCHLAVL